MAIETICSGCGQKLAVSDDNAGKRARCPACGQIYSVPFPTNQFGETVSAAPLRDIPSLAETTAGPGESDPSEQLSQPTNAPIEQYWMQTVDGSLYGPVDRANLNRWFNQGRVGPGYRIRVGEARLWQPADIFKPQTQAVSGFGAVGQAGAAAGTNPYADNAYRPTHPVSIGRYQKADPSGLVLTMGILSWVCFLVCPFIHWIPGLIAWISGSSALKDIQAGIADPINRPLVQVGYYLGMVNVILTLLIVAGLVALGFIGAIANNF